MLRMAVKDVIHGDDGKEKSTWILDWIKKTHWGISPLGICGSLLWPLGYALNHGGCPPLILDGGESKRDDLVNWEVCCGSKEDEVCSVDLGALFANNLMGFGREKVNKILWKVTLLATV